MDELKRMMQVICSEKARNDADLNASEYNDYYLGYMHGLNFAIKYINDRIKESNVTETLNFDDIKSILEREG